MLFSKMILFPTIFINKSLIQFYTLYICHSSGFDKSVSDILFIVHGMQYSHIIQHFTDNKIKIVDGVYCIAVQSKTKHLDIKRNKNCHQSRLMDYFIKLHVDDDDDDDDDDS